MLRASVGEGGVINSKDFSGFDGGSVQELIIII